MEEAELEIRFSELICGLENKSILLFDVRTKEEVEKEGKYPFSTVANIPVDEITEALGMNDSIFFEKYGIKKPYSGDAIAFSCTKGKRATKAYQTALDFGFTNARVYRGSFNDWVNKGGQVICCKTCFK